MLKLYKKVDGVLQYWETWEEDETTAVLHWGVVGERGQNDTARSDSAENLEPKIQKLVAAKMAAGFEEIDEFYSLLVEYKISGKGTPKDHDKMDRLEALLDEILGWNGLGECDGNNMNVGSMSAYCAVVDFDLAKKVIATNLEGTEFGDFARIYDEHAGK